MISRKQFMALKRGDVVLFNGTPRTIQSGPGDGQYHSITFAIRRRSWTSKGWTVYFIGDVRHKLKMLPSKMFSAICNLEKEHLKSIGFNWKKELRDAIKQEKECNKRMGRKNSMAIKLAERYLKK